MFKDRAGREWDLSLTFGAVKRIRESTGVAILKENADGRPAWLDLPFDPEKFVAALWAIVSPKAAVTRDEFEEAFDAPTYQTAAAKFYDAVTSFSPLPAVLYGTGEEMIRRMREAASISSNGGGNSPAGVVSFHST